VKEAVVAGALAVAALNLVPALLGGSLWRLGVTDGRGVRLFWIALRVGQGSALAFAIEVGSLSAAGHSAKEGLFYLYALLPLAVAFVAEQLRIAAAQTILEHRGLRDAQAVGGLPPPEQNAIVAAIVSREVGVMALSALVVALLAIRAATTAHGF
jgi:hypothetical protein